MESTTYRSKGYVVIPGIIDKQTASDVSRSVVQDLCDIAFRHEQRKPSPAKDETLRLFIDGELRQKKLSDPTCVWEGGNPRRPLIAKNTGMANLSYNPDVRRHIAFNPKVYEAIAGLYEEKHLAYLHGPDRLSLKIKGSGDMPLHLDHHLFRRFTAPGIDGRFDERVQAFVCGQVPQDVALEESGTLELIPYFHRYFALAQAYFDPDNGLRRLAVRRSPFHILGKEFERFLDDFNEFISHYTPLYQQLEAGAAPDELAGDEEAREFLLSHWIPVPTDELFPLQLTPVACEAGDLVCFDQRLPHRNLRNVSDTARIVFYVRLFKVPAQWYGSREHMALMTHHTAGTVKGSTQRDNQLERDVLQRDVTFDADDPQVQRLYERLQAITPWEDAA